MHPSPHDFTGSREYTKQIAGEQIFAEICAGVRCFRLNARPLLNDLKINCVREIFVEREKTVSFNPRHNIEANLPICPPSTI